jgi:hypothetical protein
VPFEAARNPVRIFMVVVFPAPLGPRKAATWPLDTENDTSLSAVKLPYTLESFSAWIMMEASVIGNFHINYVRIMQVLAKPEAG